MIDVMVEIDGKQLPVIWYRDTPVVTTELLADMYGASPKNLRDNYAYNKDRFEEGKHFFMLKGESLRDFKNIHRTGISGSVEISPRVNALALWTERGAARHAKMLDTDAAWDVFEKLEDAYFNKHEVKPASDFADTFNQALSDVACPNPDERPVSADAVFATELHRVFREHITLGYTKERAAVIAELIVGGD